MTYSLEINNLTKIYNKKKNSGIFDLNFKVKKGDFHAFIGENGAGKTTTIKSIIGALSNIDGEILIDGINNKLIASKQKLAYVPEVMLFPENLTTWNYLTLLSNLNNIVDIETKINNLLDIFEISHLKNKNPNQMSSGQKKKIILIQALLNEPDLLILDEPASNLDPTARYQLFKLLKELNQKGTTIFISSHILSELDQYVNSFTLIHQGQIIDSGVKTKNLEELFYEKIINN
ncbi:ATP-binding cassette domain-containing protein [Mycoplasma sp. NEAQ87857]|uniref:ABC transporter ATP-binding protein n=1 Tax=Mycoplasma sp. NEAQ87857 TaxID=2683967 RepID=UPI0013194808|nr:ABC transporter ATP-binding protein [Mycoplasma sp. NEAQ87857]QGZ97587.1 ATP-binding cassette domain-containing protein [Mycoplasma sp. NEAQ87857]